jgi:5-(carboxyamino)imidazole ribonucleotide synthase
MLNILGEPGYTGPVHYEGLDQALTLPGVYAHLYGKMETRPFRKMGHFTVVGQDLATVQDTIQQLKQLVKCISRA